MKWTYYVKPTLACLFDETSGRVWHGMQALGWERGPINERACCSTHLPTNARSSWREELWLLAVNANIMLLSSVLLISKRSSRAPSHRDRKGWANIQFACLTTTQPREPVSHLLFIHGPAQEFYCLLKRISTRRGARNRALFASIRELARVLFIVTVFARLHLFDGHENDGVAQQQQPQQQRLCHSAQQAFRSFVSFMFDDLLDR